MTIPPKDPGATLDYGHLWGPWLDSIRCAVYADSDTFIMVEDGQFLTDGQEVAIAVEEPARSLPQGLDKNTLYYVRDVSGTEFKVSTTIDGDAVDVASNDTVLVCRRQLATSSWTVPAGGTLVKESDSKNLTEATVVLSGGTAGQNYAVVNRVTTTGSPVRIDERTLSISVADT